MGKTQYLLNHLAEQRHITLNREKKLVVFWGCGNKWAGAVGFGGNEDRGYEAFMTRRVEVFKVQGIVPDLINGI